MTMKRVAHIEGNHIINVSLARDDAELQPGQMLEADAQVAGYTHAPRDIAAARKVWPNAHAFWESFIPAEQLAILNSQVTEIRLLDRALVLWQGELWSDHARVQQGLGALVATGILTEARRDEILALTP